MVGPVGDIGRHPQIRARILDENDLCDLAVIVVMKKPQQFLGNPVDRPQHRNAVDDLFQEIQHMGLVLLQEIADIHHDRDRAGKQQHGDEDALVAPVNVQHRVSQQSLDVEHDLENDHDGQQAQHADQEILEIPLELGFHDLMSTSQAC